MFMRAISLGCARPALVARWQHRDAEVDVAPSDTVRIVMSLQDGQRVHDRAAGLAPTHIRAGSVTAFPAEARTRLMVEGRADVVQVFLPDAFIDRAAERSFARRALFNTHDGELQAAVMQLVVGAVRSDPDDALLLEASCHRIALRLLAHSDQAASRSLVAARGGLAPSILRRVDDLIDAALDTPGARPPTLAALAEAAGLSVSHFIRAFRRQVGVTPHRHVLQRRIERAITLLKRPAQSVGDVADETGFASSAHFVATFRRMVGVTPGSVRLALVG